MLAVCPVALVLTLAREAAIDLRDLTAAATCPSAALLADALEARLPGVVAPAPSSDNGGLLRLELGTASAAGLHFSLVDDAGRTHLERTLSLPDGAGAVRTGACALRAETIALVVLRYLQGLGYRDQTRAPPAQAPAERREAPPPPPAPSAPPAAMPRFIVAAGIGVIPGDRWPTRREAQAVAEVIAAPVSFSFALAVTLPIEVPIPSIAGAQAALTYQALPVRIGIGWLFQLPRQLGWVAPTLFAGADLYSAASRGLAGPARVRGIEPTAELGLAATLHLAHNWALRPQALVGVQRERAFELADAAPGTPPIFVKPTFSVRLSIGLAYLFGKK